jgi:hypothetical protein
MALSSQVPSPELLLGQTTSINRFADEAYTSLSQFLPSLVWAIILLILGWLVATIVAFAVKELTAQD